MHTQNRLAVLSPAQAVSLALSILAPALLFAALISAAAKAHGAECRQVFSNPISEVAARPASSIFSYFHDRSVFAESEVTVIGTFAATYQPLPKLASLAKQLLSVHGIERARSLLYIGAGFDAGRLRRVVAVTETSAGGPALTHGIVEFDQGAGTPVQHYVHLQSRVDTREQAAAPAWLAPMLEHGIDVLLVRASLTINSDSISGHWFNENALTRGLYDHFRSRGGYIIDGDKIYWPRLADWRYNPTAFSHVRTHLLQGGFGYSGLQTAVFAIDVAPGPEHSLDRSAESVPQ